MPASRLIGWSCYGLIGLGLSVGIGRLVEGSAGWIVAALVAIGWTALGWTIGHRPRVVPEEPLTPPDRPRDDRPPDGLVGLVPVGGARGEPNAEDPRFQRFLGWEAELPEASKRSFRRWGRRFPPLIGRAAVISVFVGRDGKAWSEAEIAQAHRALARAGQWVEREASRWNVHANVDVADTYIAEVEEAEELEIALPERLEDWQASGPIHPQAEVRALAGLSRLAARLGFRDAVDLVGQFTRRIDADQFIWLLHHRRAGNSIAVPSDLSGLPGVTLAVCYAREQPTEGPLAKPPFPDPVTFVHELMHLFGAMDKYREPLSSFPRGSVSERDVMCLNFEALSRLRVDPLTAFEIGWSPSPTARPTGTALPFRPPPPSVTKNARPGSKKAVGRASGLRAKRNRPRSDSDPAG